jgi:uncharacterized protein (TIGR00299 family) protein
MNIAYFDCFSGAGGDMIVASLIDAGADADALRRDLASLGVGGYSLSIESVNKQGFAATRFHVELDPEEKQPHRHLKDIVGILEASKLTDRVKQNATRVFERLAEAEARVHGTTIDRVHFHEVGAVDAIIDVVGAVQALELLGVEEVVCSPVPTGSGTVKCDHGVMPVPAPATAELLKGVPLAESDEVGELVTPTAAALLTTLAHKFGPIPAMMVSSIGYGAGTREGVRVPNLLRVLTGRPTDAGETDRITVLETNLDDASPELIGHCMERLLNEGALDVFAVPIHMKKSRTGVVLTVLCGPGRVAVMERILFAETTTFGIRRYQVDRTKMVRRHETVATPFGDIRMKIGLRNGITTVSPEYEDCKAAAHEHGVALRDVIAAANQAWAARPQS